MNWKKWDENTWVNVERLLSFEISYIKDKNIYLLDVFTEYSCDPYRQSFFKTREGAVAFIEELIK